MTSCHGNTGCSLRLLSTTYFVKARTSSSETVFIRHLMFIPQAPYYRQIRCVALSSIQETTQHFLISDLSCFVFVSFCITQHLQGYVIFLVVCPIFLLNNDRNCVGCDFIDGQVMKMRLCDTTGCPVYFRSEIMVRVSGYRSRGPGFDSRRFQIF
jgi:hypothetical protein